MIQYKSHKIYVHEPQFPTVGLDNLAQIAAIVVLKIDQMRNNLEFKIEKLLLEVCNI